MLRREFLGWDRPFPELLVDWLLARGEGLPRLLVVVPTAQAGRRLREALAERAGALLAPGVVTPEWFFRLEDVEGVASPVEERLAWVEVLRELSPREAPALFPVEPVERSFSWAAGVARELERVRNVLAEGGKGFADAAEASPERERWADLVEVERRVLERLRGWGLEDAVGAKVRRAAEFRLPAGVEEVVVAGVPDPAPLALVAWRNVEVRVLVHAPEGDAFDEWGRPLPGGVWTRRGVPVPGERVHLVAGPAEAAAKVVACCGGCASDEVAVGLCDGAFGPALEAAFAEAGWPAWNPEGRMAGRPMLLLLEAFAGLVRRGGRWEEAAAILRSPLLGEVVGRRGMYAAMRVLDGLEEVHLPDGLERVVELCEWRRKGAEEADEGVEKLAEVLGWCGRWRGGFGVGRTGAALGAWVEEMEGAGVDDGAEGKLLEALREVGGAVRRLEERGLLKGEGEALELALSSVERLRSAAGREEAVVDLLGWLELSYAGGRRVVLAGLHEGAVPDGRIDDVFLPDGVRRGLGLRDADGRHARDAYLFHALAASREVDVVVAKVDAVGEPRRPSRLLLAAEGAELAERVKALAGSPPGGAGRLAPWTRGEWRLELGGAVRRYLDGERLLSPSAIRDYLHCPFRFYLKRVLGWERYEAEKLEMDALDFGNLCHEALEGMGRDAGMVETVDAVELRDFLWERLDGFLARYGRLSLPLMVQREAARARMERFAELEVEQRLGGWRTVYVELRVGEGLPWSVDGQGVSMQIDRVDRHPEKGWRVLDYKTSARAETPRAAHLRRASERRRNFGPVMAGARGAEEVWKGVQVPLYAAFVREWLGLEGLPAIGYVNLPAALNDVGFVMWEDFSEEAMGVALEWVRGVVAGLREGVHWPPVVLGGREAGYDDFAGIAPDGLEAAVGGKLVEELREIAERWERGGVW